MGLMDLLRNFLGLDEEEEMDFDEEEVEDYEEPQEYREEERPVSRQYIRTYDNITDKTVFVYRAQVFDDVRYIKPVMKKDVPVIVDLSAIDDKNDRRRFLDFAWGMSRAGGGRIRVLDGKDLFFALILPSENWTLIDEESPSLSEPEDVEEEE